jgi:hypothetical protein
MSGRRQRRGNPRFVSGWPDKMDNSRVTAAELARFEREMDGKAFTRRELEQSQAYSLAAEQGKTVDGTPLTPPIVQNSPYRPWSPAKSPVLNNFRGKPIPRTKWYLFILFFYFIILFKIKH